jgi:GT2 family glycosyltransferase
MQVGLRGVVIDCVDPMALADWWHALTGWPLETRDDAWSSLLPPEGTTLGFQRVPEPKAGKNRVHVDLEVEDEVAAAVDAQERLGAAVLWRRAALEDCAVGAEVLDEDMELWATESDLAWRAQLRGWRCVYEPRAVARHVRTYSPSTPRERLAAGHRRMQFRNRLLMAYKNETPLGLLVDLPFILAYEIAALGFALLRERELLGAYREAWALRAGARRRRRVVQQRRSVRRPPFGLAPPA